MPVRDKVQVDILTETRKSQTNLKQLVAGFVTAQAAWAAAQKVLQKTVQFMQESVQLAKAQEEAETKLAGVLRATGEAAGFNAGELKEMASGLQSVTTYGDEAILGMQSVLLTFKGLQGEAFERTQELALDLSATFGQDLKSSAIQLGKALEDPKRGLTSLRRIGVSFTGEQEKLIKSLVDAGEAAKAQGIILDTLEGQVGGVAREMAETTSGSITQMQNAMGDLKEEIGFVITEAFGPLAKIIKRNAEINAEYLRSLRELEQMFEEIGQGQDYASTEQLQDQLEGIDRAIEAIQAKQGKLQFADIFGGSSRMNQTMQLNELLKIRDEVVQALNDSTSESVRQEKELYALRLASGEHLRDFNEVYEEQFAVQEKSAAHQAHVLRVTREVNQVLDSAKTEYQKLNEQLEYFEQLAENGWKVGGKLADAIEIIQDRIKEIETGQGTLTEQGQKWKEDITYVRDMFGEIEDSLRDITGGMSSFINPIYAMFSKMQQQIETFKDAVKYLKDAMLDAAGQGFLEAMDEIGEALVKMKDGTGQMTDALEDFVGAIINAMPKLLFYAGVQLLATPSWPIGLGLIILSGLAAIAKGAYNASVDDGKDGSGTESKEENTTIIYVEGSVVSEAELERVVTSSQSRSYGSY